MNIKSHIDEANARSIKLYLKRQQIQIQLQQIQIVAQQIDMELTKLDGQIEAFESLQETEKSEEVKNSNPTPKPRREKRVPLKVAGSQNG